VAQLLPKNRTFMPSGKELELLFTTDWSTDDFVKFQKESIGSGSLE
jgi:hypothetical protein